MKALFIFATFLVSLQLVSSSLSSKEFNVNSLNCYHESLKFLQDFIKPKEEEPKEDSGPQKISTIDEEVVTNSESIKQKKEIKKPKEEVFGVPLTDDLITRVKFYTYAIMEKEATTLSAQFDKKRKNKHETQLLPNTDDKDTRKVSLGKEIQQPNHDTPPSKKSSKSFKTLFGKKTPESDTFQNLNFGQSEFETLESSNSDRVLKLEKRTSESSLDLSSLDLKFVPETKLLGELVKVSQLTSEKTLFDIKSPLCKYVLEEALVSLLVSNDRIYYQSTKQSLRGFGKDATVGIPYLGRAIASAIGPIVDKNQRDEDRLIELKHYLRSILISALIRQVTIASTCQVAITNFQNYIRLFTRESVDGRDFKTTINCFKLLTKSKNRTKRLRRWAPLIRIFANLQDDDFFSKVEDLPRLIKLLRANPGREDEA